MNKIIFLIVFSVSLAPALAQKETFDLTSYTRPKGWKKEVAESVVQFSKEDSVKGSYCLITLYKAVPGSSKSKENFDLAWASLVKEMVKISTAPEMLEVSTENGWETQSGYAPFDNDGNKGVALLATATASEKMVNMIILTNSADYEKEMDDFIQSISLKKNDSKPANKTASSASEPILGKWTMTSSSQSSYEINNGINGYIKRQYTFNANGTYEFVIKTFQYTSDKILLTREKGVFQVDGKNIIVNPQQSVIESWTKKDGVDKWGKLVSSQKRNLEKTTYQFTKHYFEGIQQWNLVLQTTKPTVRDGAFSNNNTFSNAYYYIAPSPNNPVIELPDSHGDATQSSTQVLKTPETNTPSAKPTTAGGFSFSTTNFDDGWTSVAKENWVEVTKGNIKVLLHYPTDQIKAANTDVDVMCSAAWNFLVAPRYSNIEGYRITPGMLDYERPYYAEALLTDANGSKVFVVLFKKATAWMEFITPDKKTFIEVFGLDISKVDYYSDSEIWNKMKQMNNYNKFAIAASDFTGKWNDRFSANTFYTNIYTGASAGMSTYSSTETFEFLSNNAYKWNLVAANSGGGASQFASAKGAGNFKVLNNWQIFFSEMEGKPKTFDAYFSCVKGGRVLWMNDAQFPGRPFSGFMKE